MPDMVTLKVDVFAAIASLSDAPSLTISDATPLIGDGSVLNSSRLVELCLALEDKATGLGFEFDWTSEAATVEISQHVPERRLFGG